MQLFKAIAEREGFTGGVYQAVGPPAGGEPWTDEGHIAQFPAIKKALVPANSEVIALKETEYIYFPTDYITGDPDEPRFSGPIRHVVKL